LQDVQATSIHGGWWKYVCPLPDFPTTDPNYIPYPDHLHAQVQLESLILASLQFSQFHQHTSEDFIPAEWLSYNISMVTNYLL